MKKKTLIATALATAFTASFAFASWSYQDSSDQRGHGYRGCGYEQHMGKGGKLGGRFHGKFMQERMDRVLTADEVRTLQEARLIHRNNPNIKVGEVKATDSGYTVTIVTQDNSLVKELSLAKNGMRLEHYNRMQQRMERMEKKAARN